MVQELPNKKDLWLGTVTYTSMYHISIVPATGYIKSPKKSGLANVHTMPLGALGMHQVNLGNLAFRVY